MMKTVHCQNKEHQGETVVLLCIDPDCTYSRKMCVKCLSQHPKHQIISINLETGESQFNLFRINANSAAKYQQIVDNIKAQLFLFQQKLSDSFKYFQKLKQRSIRKYGYISKTIIGTFDSEAHMKTGMKILDPQTTRQEIQFIAKAIQSLGKPHHSLPKLSNAVKQMISKLISTLQTTEGVVINAMDQLYNSIDKQNIIDNNYIQRQQQIQVKTKEQPKTVTNIGTTIPKIRFKWNSNFLGSKNYKINEELKTLEKINNNDWTNLVSRQRIPKTGKYVISYKQLKTSNNATFVGIITEDIRLENKVSWHKQCINYNCRGSLNYDGTSIKVCSTDVNRLVRMEVNMDEKTISWFDENSSKICSQVLNQTFRSKNIYLSVTLLYIGDTIQMIIQ